MRKTTKSLSLSGGLGDIFGHRCQRNPISRKDPLWITRNSVNIDHVSSGSERQSPMQPHTDLDKVRLVLWRDDAMSNKKVDQNRS
jgi:hypothetical protein